MVENKFGVLARIATLFAARGYNIDSLAVGETEDPAVSRMTIVASGSEAVLEQVEKQLNKLIDVIKVSSFVKEPHIERDLALDQGQGRQVHQAARFFRSSIFSAPRSSTCRRIRSSSRSRATKRRSRRSGNAVAAVRHQGNGPDRHHRDGPRNQRKNEGT